MRETNAIKFFVLHQEGDAHEWWYYGLITLRHASITSYTNLTHGLVERFDRKDPELHFRELGNLKKRDNTKASLAEFQRLLVMVSNISEVRLIMLFIDGFFEPLRGWVQSNWSLSFQDVVSRGRGMLDVVSKTRALEPTRPTFP